MTAEIHSWGAQSTRAVFFTATGHAAEEVFKTGFDAKPAHYQNAPGAPPFGGNKAGGPYEGLQATVAKAGGRVDLILTPTGESNVDTPPVISDYAAATAKLMRAIEKIAPFIKPITRVSLVVDLIKVCADIEEARRVIGSILPFSFDTAGKNDIVFQYNSRKKIKNATINTNNIFKYALVEFQTMNIEIVNGMPVPQSSGNVSAQIVSRQYGVQIQLDLNSVPSDKALSTKQSVDVFREFNSIISEFEIKAVR